jgi:kynurenine 3-monooxygenase
MVTALLDKFPEYEIYLYEKRPKTNVDTTSSTDEFGNSTSAVRRSINLALSNRGIYALEELGLLETVLKTTIRMPKRVIHHRDGKEIFQAYGKADDETLYSVGREYLNNLMVNFVTNKANSKVHVFYGYSLQNVDKNGNCIFYNSETKQEVHESFDLVIGSDGAYSSVRENMLRLGRIDFQRHYVRHGYKELTIAAKKNSSTGEPEYALKNFEGLHIWPRNDFMLIALPNPDKSFTATLFAPYKGIHGFDSVNPSDENQIRAFFQEHFPDVVPLMPNLIQDYRTNPVGSLVTVKCEPWNIGKIVLIGDAAHAVVPFCGQGMNAAFQDGLLLYQTIAKHRTLAQNNNKGKTSSDIRYLMDGVVEFSKDRIPSTNALAELSLEHYHDMAANTASLWYLFNKRVEKTFANILPNIFRPLYGMIAFSGIPYHHAIERAHLQEQWIHRIIIGCSLATTGLILYHYDVRNAVRDLHHRFLMR